MPLTEQENQFFYKCAEEILSVPEIRRMDDFRQHASTSCLEHCIAVAYYSFWLSRRMRLDIDAKSLIRGALLHDFFLYDWRDGLKEHNWHAFKHPRRALNKASEYFSLNATEEDIIRKHMWPLTISFPRCKEAFVVSCLDKWCAVVEGLRLYRIMPYRRTAVRRLTEAVA